MDYGRVVKRAAELTWRHRALWFFGFLLALFGARGGGQGVQYRIDQTDLARPQWAWSLALLVIVLVVLFALVAIVLNNLSRGALIGLVREAEETDSTSVGRGWRIGRARLWPLIGIDLLMTIPAVSVAMALIALALSPLLLLLAKSEALTIVAIILTVLLGMAVLVVLLVAGTVLGVVREFACRQCVLEGKGAWQSIGDGYHMVRGNLRQVGVMWLLLLGIDLLAGVIATPLLLVLFGVVAGTGAGAYAATESVVSAIVVGLLLGLPAVLIVAVANGVYLAFRSTTWTLAYRELQVQPSLA